MNHIIGLDNFYVWRATNEEPCPDVSFVPAMMRRRMTNIQKIAVGLAARVAPAVGNYRTVFASRYGEWQTTLRLIEQFNSDMSMSPAGFSNSVHNAAVGVWSIIAKNTADYSSVAAGERTLGMGILTALIGRGPVLFVYAEENAPDMYLSYLNGSCAAHGLAFFIDENAKRKIQWDIQNQNDAPLDFNAMSDFLQNGGEILASGWKMVDR